MRLAKKFERPILLLPCRRHIYEVVLSHVFILLFGNTVGPACQFFVKFKNEFSELDPDLLKSGVIDCARSFRKVKNQLIEFIEGQLLMNQQRNDYKELLELALSFLTDPGRFTIKSPGAISHARWMCRLIYCLKIYLFRDQLSKEVFDFGNILRFCVFGLKVYLKPWFLASVSTRSPSVDLEFVHNILKFEDKELSAVAYKAFNNHQQYFRTELVCLSLFDQNLSSDLKDKFRANFSKRPTSVKDVTSSTKLESFFSKDSVKFFESLGVESDFLKSPAELWDGHPNYNRALDIVKNLNVVNDPAERGVNLATEFNNNVTRSNQNSDLYQVVERDRKVRNKCTKLIYSKTFN